ncbi:MAG: hypothetical protein ACHQ5A_12375, partial [Opitutales bacterium]
MRNFAETSRKSTSRVVPRAWFFLLALTAAAIAPRLPAQAASSVPGDATDLRARAEQGDPEAQNTLGNNYTSGQGVAQNYAEALKWYKAAAEKGFAAAQFNLGLAHELGRGVPVDEKQAFRYYMMAAEQGFGPAQFNVGNMYAAGRAVGQDYFEANVWYKQAAEKGVIEAQYNLGLIYEAGRGVKKDEVQAAQWYQQAAEHGFARAQYNLGLLYEDGRGVAQSDTTAARLYQQAAEQGFGPAQNNLGLLYANGHGGLPTDPELAYAWLCLAVENGAAPQGRDFVAKSLTPAQLDKAAEYLASIRNRISRGPQAVAAAVSKQPVNPPGGVTANAGDLSLQVRQLNEALVRAQEANRQLTQENTRLQQTPAHADPDSRTRLEAAQKQISDLTRRLEEVTAARQKLAQDKAELEKWSQSLENELDARTAGKGKPQADDAGIAQL